MQRGGEQMRNVDTKALRRAMIDRDIHTIGQLEECSGINRVSLGAFLSGERAPSYDSIVKLADTLELESEDIGRIFFAS